MAAIGALAWKAYQDHQARQSAPPPTGAPGLPQAVSAAPSFAALPAPQLELHSQAMLKAMIAAAKADGHMDDRERGLVEAELTRLDADGRKLAKSRGSQSLADLREAGWTAEDVRLKLGF